ncbi:hypothetical protein ATY75_03250 [Rhizobium sp. N122]|uniref:hypothetical protein n=1 Tax=Rhizobium sp. N122 TaxID=1764272 RepID=UPI000B5ABAA5|nr:hypothetical protein [Rhizobium sp. N122]OWV87340.1 hypothetical protein ATY75_03250 [Rhizobium sp. N122]
MNRSVKAQTALQRLDALSKEVAHILNENPELAIERVSIYEHGVHTIYQIPGFSDVLPALIRGHSEAFAAWTANVGLAGDLVAEAEAFKRLECAELEFITHKCRSAHEVQMKLAYVAECRSMADSIHGEVDANGTPYQTLLLDSLRLPADTGTGRATA